MALSYYKSGPSKSIFVGGQLVNFSDFGGHSFLATEDKAIIAALKKAKGIKQSSKEEMEAAERAAGFNQAEEDSDDSPEE